MGERLERKIEIVVVPKDGWDSLPWRQGEVVSYQGRLLFRTPEGTIHCIGLAPTYTMSSPLPDDA